MYFKYKSQNTFNNTFQIQFMYKILRGLYFKYIVKIVFVLQNILWVIFLMIEFNQAHQTQKSKIANQH